MKKALVVLLALAMTLAAAVSAGEEAAAPELLNLYRTDGETAEWIAPGVLLYEGVVVTAAGAIPENLTGLKISDGQTVWNAAAMAVDEKGLITVVIFNRTDGEPATGVYELADKNDIAAGGFVVRAADGDRSRENRTVTDMITVEWKGVSCTLATLSGPAPIGSPMLTPRGRVAGIALSEWAEGSNRMVFLPAQALYNCLMDGLNSLMETPVPPEGFAVTASGNRVTFNWAKMTMPETGENEKLYLVVSDTDNDYLTYFRIDDEKLLTMTLTPGRTYDAGITAMADTPDRVPMEFARITLPEAEPLTDYGFVSHVMAIAEAPAGGLARDEQPVPVTAVSEALLRSGRAYFYSHTSYQVEKTILNVSLLVTLTDPNGNNYRYESEWVYDPSFMAEDIWSVSMEDTGLLDMLNQNGYPAGTYELAMYIGGRLADSISFELE